MFEIVEMSFVSWANFSRPKKGLLRTKMCIFMNLLQHILLTIIETYDFGEFL